MPSYRDEAVVLRTQRLGEADRIVTLLGRDRGVVRAVAKGVRRTTSKFGARLEPFMVVDLQFFEGRTLDTITQAVTVSPYAAEIVRDWDAYTSASAMVEAAERLADSADASTTQFVLLVGGLRELARGERAVADVRDTYLLRALALAGWEPEFSRCARCGEPGGHDRVSLASGGAVCRACTSEAGSTIAVSVDVMRVLWALLADHRGVLEQADEATRERAAAVVAAYAQFHLERGLRSLRVAEAARRSPLHGSGPAPAA